MKSNTTKLIAASTALAFCGTVALTTTISRADRGEGSIRGADRQGPVEHQAPAAPPAPEARHDDHAAPPAPEARHDDHPAPAPPEARHDDHPAPQPRPEDHPEARPDAHPAPPPAPARRNWDDNDDDHSHFGGYAHGGPDHHRGERIRALPDHHFDVFWNNVHYFWDDTGVCYQQQPDGQYLVIEAPVGVPISTMPDDAIPIAVGPTTYYYLDGTFFVQQGDGSYAVVAPPPGIVVPTLPSGANQAVVNGVVVYQFNGCNYTPSIQDGATVYTVTPS